MKKYFYTTIIFLMPLKCVFGQTAKGSIDSLPKLNVTLSPKIVYHGKNSKLPDKINAHGTIIDISPGYCGVICMGGVIKVKLDKTIENYNDTFVYLVTACLSTDVKKGAEVNVVATKLVREDKECYYLSISNSFDSKGTPFYKLSEQETNKIK